MKLLLKLLLVYVCSQNDGMVLDVKKSKELAVLIFDTLFVRLFGVRVELQGEGVSPTNGRELGASS